MIYWTIRIVSVLIGVSIGLLAVMVTGSHTVGLYVFMGFAAGMILRKAPRKRPCKHDRYTMLYQWIDGTPCINVRCLDCGWHDAGPVHAAPCTREEWLEQNEGK